MSSSEEFSSDEGAMLEDRGVGEKEDRPQYANKCELMLSLVGYAVGLGNIWRFPYLAYSYGGAAFLIPYFIALVVLGLPLFILELGLGQMFRQGTLGVWGALGKKRLQGVGIAATICTFFVSLYYNVIIAWTLYYLGRTTIAMFSPGMVPWSHEVPGFQCPPTVMFPNATIAGRNDLFHPTTGLFNESYRNKASFWCPPYGIPINTSVAPAGYVKKVWTPTECPARAAVAFWETEVLNQSSGMDNFGSGIQWGLFAAYTAAWLLVYFIVFKGVGSSGKVVYVTALAPYVALLAFFIRAITLPNAWVGLKYFLIPDFSKLANFEVWQKAVTQIFYSLGVGFGSLIAFASYGAKNDDFVGNAKKVSIINCSTSMFAGLVVFPILGYLAHEMRGVNPCIEGDNLQDLTSIGLSGTGLAFIAFPIAISRMYGSFFWAFLFFLMLLCLGIDSEFAMIESVMTVIHDSNMAPNLSKPVLAAIVCGVSYVLGLVFVTQAGVYWFNLFDNYSCIVAMYFVTFMEVFWLMWGDDAIYENFATRVKAWTGRKISNYYKGMWKYACPVIILSLLIMAFSTHDIMKAETSQPYPAGSGFLPGWSVNLGWKLGMLPLFAFLATYIVMLEKDVDSNTVAARDINSRLGVSPMATNGAK
mmetsp:Transcript_136806/g.424925  ORF Transcript_136806/g.424925 Transcript_136806/m.424925 type:complete len:644 (+) Transcript_136806:90-2021(+)